MPAQKWCRVRSDHMQNLIRSFHKLFERPMRKSSITKPVLKQWESNHSVRNILICGYIKIYMIKNQNKHIPSDICGVCCKFYGKFTENFDDKSPFIAVAWKEDKKSNKDVCDISKKVMGLYSSWVSVYGGYHIKLSNIKHVYNGYLKLIESINQNQN